MLLVSAVALVLLGSAAIAHFVLGEFDDFGEALWSAVLHVLDPSSLHEDHDAAERAIGVFQVVTGLVLLVGLLFTFVAEVVANSLERLGQSDRPVTCHDHLLVVGGPDLASVAASAASEAQLETELKRLVVLAPESARDSRAPDTRRPRRGRRRPQDRPPLRRHRRRLGLRACRRRAGAGDPADALEQRPGRRPRRRTSR